MSSSLTLILAQRLGRRVCKDCKQPQEAVEEMLVKTSTRPAPWSLIEGNDKNWARTRVLERLVEVLSAELNYKPADPIGDRRAKTKAKTGRAAKPSRRMNSQAE